MKQVQRYKLNKAQKQKQGEQNFGNVQKVIYIYIYICILQNASVSSYRHHVCTSCAYVQYEKEEQEQALVDSKLKAEVSRMEQGTDQVSLLAFLI